MSTRNTHFYGEPYYLEDGNVIKNRDGMWIADVKDSEWAERLVETINILAPHPDLSAVEVHSKETMDEVRAILKDCRAMVKNEILDCEMKGISANAWPDLLNGCVSGGGLESALAKLNPPQ